MDDQIPHESGLNPDHPKCGAKTRAGLPCPNPAMPNGRCYKHGGSTPVGLAAGSFKTGRYSKHLPARLVADYEEFINDPDRLSLDHEMGVLRARIGDLTKRADFGESGKLWQDAKAAYREFQQAGQSKDEPRMAAALSNLGKVLNRGNQDWHTWNEIGRTMEQYRRLSETQNRIDTAKKTAIQTDRAMVLFAAVLDIIRTNVSDRPTLAAITKGIAALMQPQQPTQLPGRVIDQDDDDE